MRLQDALSLKPGQLIHAIHAVEAGGESHWNIEERRYVRENIFAGQPLRFKAIIPKVRIIGPPPVNDRRDVMIFCETVEGERAWLNICNAKF